MKNHFLTNVLPLAFLYFISFACVNHADNQGRIDYLGKFDLRKDFLLLHYDCKTDVDDLHSVAAAFTLLEQDPYDRIDYRAVSGTYGIQDGSYVPGEELFALAFGSKWSDAHADRRQAIEECYEAIKSSISTGGSIWIAEGGQSDFTLDLLQRIYDDHRKFDFKKRFHVVQHSKWNEETAGPNVLDRLKSAASYYRIPDGNATDNGTPGFNSPENPEWDVLAPSRKARQVWNVAMDIANNYNGVSGRYLNESVALGGLDFSDFAEVCWILGLEDLHDRQEFFELLSVEGD